MEVVSAKIPDDLDEWLDGRAKDVKKSKSSLVREMTETARAVEDGEKVIIDLPQRERDRLEEWGAARGLTPSEASEEILREWLKTTEAAEGTGVAEYIERVEAENEQLQGQNSPGLREWAKVTRSQPVGFQASLSGIVITSIAVCFIALIILIEDLVGPVHWLPEFLAIVLILAPVVGGCFVVFGALFELFRYIGGSWLSR